MSRLTSLSEQTFDSLDAMMQAWAAEAVRIAAEDHGMDLDFSPDSIARLETVLAARGPVPADQQDEAARLWGGYFGEIFATATNAAGSWPSIPASSTQAAPITAPNWPCRPSTFTALMSIRC